MAKGMSTLRQYMRNAPRKTLPDSIDAISSALDGPGAATEARQPLGRIPETARNALTPAGLEQSVGDRPSTPRGKPEQSSPRAVHEEEFPHLENSVGNSNLIKNVTPDQDALTSLASSAGAHLNSNHKFTWQHHRSTAQNIPSDGPTALTTPPRPSKQSLSSDAPEAFAAGWGNSPGTQDIGANRGGSAPGTPPTLRATVEARASDDLDQTCHSQSQNATQCNGVPRSLKYGQQATASNSGISGLTNVRSTLSQHVATRALGCLQAVKGVLPQTVNQNFVEQYFELEEDSSFWRDHNVQVLIRTRPISNSELAVQGLNRCLKQESPHTLSWLGQPESRFTFDHVAGETITQAKLFEVAGLPMVENCISGYNSCMFAYGQTGSGKTHTMLGDIEELDLSPSVNRGITPRVFEYLFGRIRLEEESRRQEHLKFFCKCSFLEIYNEQITDLLEPSSTNLQLREDAKKGVYVENLSEVEVEGVQDVIQLLLQGAANRRVGATNMNRESSRSHSVFTCVVESKWKTNSLTNSRYGRLHLVDLAGSERQKSSGAEGGRLKEAANINKSLSTLGLVIMILVDVANGKQRHVPYRDSKLTFLLQDSLGGNSKTIMIANVSPSSCCAMETLSTLKFAQRAKFIRNNAVINEDASGDVGALRQQIEELKVEVDRLRRERTSPLRFLALQNERVVGEGNGNQLDLSAENCIGSGRASSDTFNSSTFTKYSTVNTDKKSISVEAVSAGTWDQTAEDITKNLADEVQELNRQFILAKNNWEAEKRKMEEERDGRETDLRDEVISAELKLLATEGNLKLALENVEALGFRKVQLENEILKLNEDAGITMSKATDQQEEIDSLKEVLKLTLECTGADENSSALNDLRKQYSLSEETWRSKEELLMKRLEELEGSSGLRNSADNREASGGSGSLSSQCLPICVPPSEGEKHLEDIQQLQRHRLDNQALRAKVDEKNMTISSARKEMEIAIANLKETELEIDKVHREKKMLSKSHLEQNSLLDSMSLKLKSAEEELSKRDIKIEECEAELRKVAVTLFEWDVKMHDLENEWRKEKEDLADQLTEAKLDASEKRNEAAVLLQQFEDGQATLKEAEGLVNALVRANENAKYQAQDWQTEKENLGIAQGWWMPERDKLVSLIAGLETDMHTQKQDMRIACKEAVAGLVDMMEILTAANQEISLLKNDHQQELDYLVREMEIMKDDLVAGLKFPVDLRADLDTFFTSCKNQTDQLTELKSRNDLMTQNLQSGDAVRELLQAELAQAKQDFETSKNHLEASEIGRGETEEALASMQREAEAKSAELLDTEQLTELKSRNDLMTQNLQSGDAVRELLQAELAQAKQDFETAKNDLEASEIGRGETEEALASMQREAEAKSAELLDKVNDLNGQLNDSHMRAAAVEEELNGTAKETQLLKKRLIDVEGAKAESFHSMTEVIHLLTSERDNALKDNVDLIADITSLEGNLCSLELELEEERKVIGHLKDQRQLQVADAEQAGVAAQNGQSEPRQKQGIACANTMTTLGFCATLMSEMPDIFVQCEELGLLQDLRRLDYNPCSDFEVREEYSLKFEQTAQEDLRAWRQRNNVTEKENKKLMAEVQELQSRNFLLEDNLAEKRHSLYVPGEIMLEQKSVAHSLQMIKSQLKAVERDRDKYKRELVVLNEQLKMAQALADERSMVAAEARQAAERTKTRAEEKEEEARILGRSVEELDSTVYALESQLGIVKREAERQILGRETLEQELGALKRQMAVMQATIDSQETQSMRDLHDTETAKTDLDRIVIEMKSQQIQARKSVESLQQECAEKDVQLRSCKAHIAQLMSGAEKQASENHQKIKTLESMVEPLKVEERRVNPASSSGCKAVEKAITSKVKGGGSPFKCLGSGLSQQRTSEMDKELSAARKRIKEVEAVAASRQKEIFMLNTKLAEAESMTHDVVRDLLGVKLDIASYASLLNQQQVQKIAERIRFRTVESQQKEEELGTLRDKLNEFIEERESWLEEINRRQAEAVAARVAAEKLRLRDRTLTAENEKYEEWCSALLKEVTDLEEEIERLSGQQNVQERIHHHDKIKEENISFRQQNEDLSGKLRRMERMLTRVNDELARYRTAQGKSAFPNVDEEARLQKQLQDTEERRLQLSQNLTGLCTGIMQAAGIQSTSKELDPSAAMTALQQLSDHQEYLERELSNYKLKARIMGEKRRLSDLRDFLSPERTISTNFTASQQLPSPVFSSR